MTQVYPEKYDQLELSVDEKSFLRTVERALSGEEMAYFVLHINPRRKDTGDGKQPELFNLLIVDKGILLFRFLDVPNEVVAQITIKALMFLSSEKSPIFQLNFPPWDLKIVIFHPFNSFLKSIRITIHIDHVRLVG